MKNCCQTIPETIKISPVIVVVNIFSLSIKDIKIRDIKGAIKMRLPVLALFVLICMAFIQRR
jgi:hypothetical protein